MFMYMTHPERQFIIRLIDRRAPQVKLGVTKCCNEELKVRAKYTFQWTKQINNNNPPRALVLDM